MNTVMKRAAVMGVGKTNYNYKKIEGFIKAFQKKGYDVVHASRIPPSKELANLGPIDVAFSEYGVEFEDYSNIKTFISWANYPIESMIALANKHPSTKFILAPKSLMHNVELVNEYQNRFGKDYQVTHALEGQDIGVLIEKLKALSKPSYLDPRIGRYRLLDNLSYVYAPCCLSEKIAPELLKPNKFKFAYFGTIGNRPRVLEALRFLDSKGVPLCVNFVENGVVSPEDCMEIYKETEYVLHEQIQPVILEHPVRLGEATAHGCKIVAIEDINLQEHATKFVPDYMKFTSVDEFKTAFNDGLFPTRNLEERQEQARSFYQTYDNMLGHLLGH